jgi:hypothetical protein
MPLKVNQIPAAASQAIQGGLAALARNRGQVSSEFAEKLADGAQPVAAGAHQIFNLGLDDLRNERGLDAATSVGWRSIVLKNDTAVAAAEAYPTDRGNWSFGNANYGPFVESTVEALHRAEKHPRVRTATYEPRVLRVPALYVMALWLFSSRQSLFFPLSPAPKELTAYRAYKETEFLRILTAMAKELKPAPSPGLFSAAARTPNISISAVRRPLVKAATAAHSDLAAAKNKWSQRLLSPLRRPEGIRSFNAAIGTAPDQNVVGVGIGEKVTDGKLTGVTAIKFFVNVKFPKSQLSGKSIAALPEHIDGLPVDVEQVGIFRRFARQPHAVRARKPAITTLAPTTPDSKTRFRPAQPGSSVGFEDPSKQFVMAGTFGALVKDASGIYILSNNHVLANEDRLSSGAPIFQPGLLDHGNAATDQIAQLSRAIKLDISTPNKVDCAIASLLDPSLANNDTLYIGPPAGTKPAQIDMVVHKFGRTTTYTVGRISSIDTDVAVNYDSGRLVFQNQVIVVGLDGSTFSDAGDSGSLIMERGTNAAVALLFAGSSTHTIANHIEDVLSSLGTTLA